MANFVIDQTMTGRKQAVNFDTLNGNDNVTQENDRL